MKTLIKILALAIVAVMVLSLFAACGGDDAKDTGSESAVDTADDAEVKDLDAVKANGKLVVGMTDYAPMNYKDENDEWTGFDTEFAQAFAKTLDVDVEFVEIEWDNKWFELSSGNVDCIWNGMTITDEGKLNADISVPYAKNNQVLVTTAEDAENIAAVSDVDGKIAVESGSAGMSAAEDAELDIAEYALQTDALLAVKSGKAVGCVIDATMALAMIQDGSDYEGLSIALTLTDEEYGVAFRKGSDLTSVFNDAYKAFLGDGTLADLSIRYNIELAD